MPSGYTKKRRIFCLYTDPFSQIITPMVQRGDVFLWDTPKRDATAAQHVGNPLPATITLTVPNVSVEAKITVIASVAGASVITFRFRSPLIADVGATPDLTSQFNFLLNASMGWTGGTTGTGAEVSDYQILTANRQIAIDSSGGDCMVRIDTTGWVDGRAA